MNNAVSKAPLLVPILMAAVLSACSEPAKPAADFSPQSAEAGAEAGAEAAAGPKPAPGAAPIELPYDERRVALIAAKECNLERANGQRFDGQPMEVSKKSPVTLIGWVASAEQKNVPATVDLRLVSTPDNRAWKVSTPTGIARQDVMALLGGDAGFSNPGYSVELNLSSLPSGVYRAYVVFRDGEAMKSCDNGRAISLID